MRILGTLASKYKPGLPLAGKTILACTHATTATAKLITAITQIGANVVYVPISYSRNESALAQSLHMLPKPVAFTSLRHSAHTSIGLNAEKR